MRAEQLTALSCKFTIAAVPHRFLSVCSSRKVPDRTLTRSDIQRMVQAIRIKKSREHSNYQEDETSDAVVSNEARYTSSGTLFDS